jgi:hypothetical protein
LLAAVRENRPEIAEARVAIDESRRSLAKAMADGVPDVEIGPRFNDAFRDPGDTAGLRVQTDLPLFDRNQGGVAESSATIGLNEANLRVIEMTTLSDVAAAYAELEPMQRRLEYYRDKVPQLAKRAEAAIRGSFEIAKIDSNRMVNELQRLGKLKIEHLNLQYQYNRVRAKIELYAGRSLDQLAEMEAAAKAAAEREGRESGEALPQGARQGETPREGRESMPRARKADVDSRVARVGAASQVVQASGTSPLDFVKKITRRKETTKGDALPYGDVKPSAQR